MFPFHAENTATVSATPEALFAHLDDHTLLSSHMTWPSAMMAGSRMRVALDERRGSEVGARIALEGNVLALPAAGALTRWLGRALGGVYARWCTRRMVRGAVANFAAAERP